MNSVIQQMGHLFGEQDDRDQMQDKQERCPDNRALWFLGIGIRGIPSRFVKELPVTACLHGQKDAVNRQGKQYQADGMKRGEHPKATGLGEVGKNKAEQGERQNQT